MRFMKQLCLYKKYKSQHSKENEKINHCNACCLDQLQCIVRIDHPALIRSLETLPFLQIEPKKFIDDLWSLKLDDFVGVGVYDDISKIVVCAPSLPCKFLYFCLVDCSNVKSVMI